MNTKKGLIFAAFCFLLALPMFAQEKENKYNANITYQSAPIYKILDSTDYYVVLYGKYGAKLGIATIPKKWAKWQKDTPRKLTIRELPRKMSAYITIVKKDNKFLKVMLTIPTAKTNPIWGIANNKNINPPASEDELVLELR
ncbi:MAG: hypothetical protein J6Y36_06910 [Treponema sp.]|uniref:hypothetical protein n=1 Tax=Treponema sp. TaxID=166 RepID=UPI001B5F23EA|nr:hypothetical protein [Treponema sp.]MBP5402869.1 hypothetical protein [Treponema sp.]MBR5933663.1 hypothetical protein [Treponema sp.]